MKNKILAGVCLVAGMLGAGAPAVVQAEDGKAYCEKWCTKNGRSTCCPGAERKSSESSSASGIWYESDVQRCQAVLEQPNIDPDSELRGQFEKCQQVKSSADAEEKAARKKLEEEKAAKAALRQRRTSGASKQAASSLNPAADVKPTSNFSNLQNFGAQPGEMPLQPIATE